MKKTQQGIALVETLLIILILAIIGFGGYYVWHTQKENNKVTDDTLKAGNSQTTASKQSDGSAQKYLTIAEWKIKGPNSAAVHLQYKITDFAGQPAAQFTSSELLAAGGSDCVAGGGLIVQYSGSDKTDLNVTNPDQTVEQAATSGDLVYYSLVDNKYYVFTGPQAGCGDPDKIQTVQTDTLGAVKSLAQGLRAE